MRIPFELTVKVPGATASKVKAELWTNANHNDAPEKYDALPMKKVRTQGELVTYRVEVPIEKVGNYRATRAHHRERQRPLGRARRGSPTSASARTSRRTTRST